MRSSVRFRAALNDNVLEPEVFHLNPAKSDTQRFRNIIRLAAKWIAYSTPVISPSLSLSLLLFRYVPSSLSWYTAAVFAKAFALDMSQYGRLLNSTRIPRNGKDELVTYDGSNGHIAVMRKGHLYSVNAVQENGKLTAYLVHSRIFQDSGSSCKSSLQDLACTIYLPAMYIVHV